MVRAEADFASGKRERRRVEVDTLEFGGRDKGTMKRSILMAASVVAGAVLGMGQTPAPKQAPPATAAPKQATPVASPAASPAQSQAKKAAPATPAAKPSGELTPQEAANQIAEAHEAWGTDLNSSALFSASLQEVTRNGMLATFHLYTVGVPRNILYNVVAWPVNQPRPVEVVRGVALDATGMAICPGQLGTCGDPKTPNAPTNLSITLAPGRPVRVGLVSQDQQLSVYTKLVPIPIRGTSNGCALEAVLLTPNGVIAVMEGSGFAPNADIDMQLENGGERNGGKSKVDASGKFTATVVPVKEGVNFGTMKVTVTSAKCNPSVSFDWGTKPAPSLAKPEEKKQ
jgi:hypothetical protein